ncbi:MAG TPA: hypothetical protein VJ963_05130 [Bacteroidales bacterium]|nr:hypothetical protein [Bacteroidales bacterium]
MRRIIFFLIVALLAMSCNNQKVNVKSDLAVANIKGQVWKIDRKIHNACGSPVCPAAESPEVNNSSYEYDRNGNLLKMSEIDENGDTVVISKYEYDRHGLCKSVEKYKENNLDSREVNNYKNGLLTQVSIQDAEGKPRSSYKYEYSGIEQSGCRITNEKGETVGSYVNEYSSGQLSKRTQLDKMGNPSNITEYKRNDKNDISEYIITVPSDSSVFRVVLDYEYDKKGNWVQQTQRYNGDIMAIITRNIMYYDM